MEGLNSVLLVVEVTPAPWKNSHCKKVKARKRTPQTMYLNIINDGILIYMLFNYFPKEEKYIDLFKTMRSYAALFLILSLLVFHGHPCLPHRFVYIP